MLGAAGSRPTESAAISRCPSASLFSVSRIRSTPAPPPEIASPNRASSRSTEQPFSSSAREKAQSRRPGAWRRSGLPRGIGPTPHKSALRLDSVRAILFAFVPGGRLAKRHGISCREPTAATADLGHPLPGSEAARERPRPRPSFRKGSFTVIIPAHGAPVKEKRNRRRNSRFLSASRCPLRGTTDTAKGMYCLPAGQTGVQETLDVAARRSKIRLCHRHGGTLRLLHREITPLRARL